MNNNSKHENKGTGVKLTAPNADKHLSPNLSCQWLTNKTPVPKLAGLYLVLTSNCCSGRDPFVVAQESVDAGVDILQMREKDVPHDKIIEYGTKLRDICTEKKVKFIVNDDPGLAKELKADGVHIGQEDMVKTPIAALREIVGDKIIGISTHSLSQFEQANSEDVDYIAFGPIFYTKTKDYHIGMSDVRKVIETAMKPVIFIGGINKNNVHELINEGANNIAMIRAITEAEHIDETIKYFKNAIKRVKMKIKVNGKEEIFKKGKTLLDIVEEKGADPGRVVVEYDLQIINKDDWKKTFVRDGGTVEIVSFMGGG